MARLPRPGERVRVNSTLLLGAPDPFLLVVDRAGPIDAMPGYAYVSGRQLDRTGHRSADPPTTWNLTVKPGDITPLLRQERPVFDTLTRAMRDRSLVRTKVGLVDIARGTINGRYRITALAVQNDGYHTCYLEPGDNYRLCWVEGLRIGWRLTGGSWQQPGHEYRLVTPGYRPAATIALVNEGRHALVRTSVYELRHAGGHAWWLEQLRRPDPA